jgi:hypothetical protein
VEANAAQSSREAIVGALSPEPTFDNFDIYQFNFLIAAIQQLELLILANDGRADESAFCLRSYCWRSSFSHMRQRAF